MEDAEDYYRQQADRIEAQQAAEREAITLEVLDLIPRALAHVQGNPPELCTWVDDGTTIHVGWELCTFFADGDDTESVVLLNNGHIVTTWFGSGTLNHPDKVKKYLTEDVIRELGGKGSLGYLPRGLKQLLPTDPPAKKPRRKWFGRG